MAGCRNPARVVATRSGRGGAHSLTGGEPPWPYRRPLENPSLAHTTAISGLVSANDEQVQRYVDGLDFDSDEIFGIYNRRLALIAMAHLAYSVDQQINPSAEFGVSVLAQARGRGYGARLFERAVMHARNQGVRKMFVHVLSEKHRRSSKLPRHAGGDERDGGVGPRRAQP